MKKVLLGLLVLVALLSMPMAVSAITGPQQVNATILESITITWANTYGTWNLIQGPNTLNSASLTLDVVSNAQWDLAMRDSGTGAGRFYSPTATAYTMTNPVGLTWLSSVGNNCVVTLSGTDQACLSAQGARVSGPVNAILSQTVVAADKARSDYRITIVATVTATA
jgi:hypothetical protein